MCNTACLVRNGIPFILLKVNIASIVYVLIIQMNRYQKHESFITSMVKGLIQQFPWKGIIKIHISYLKSLRNPFWYYRTGKATVLERLLKAGIFPWLFRNMNLILGCRINLAWGEPELLICPLSQYLQKIKTSGGGRDRNRQYKGAQKRPRQSSA